MSQQTAYETAKLNDYYGILEDADRHEAFCEEVCELLNSAREIILNTNLNGTQSEKDATYNSFRLALEEAIEIVNRNTEGKC